MKKYRKVTAGGTFDRLHVGHEALIACAFEIADEVAIGVTSDDFVRGKQLSQVILPYSQRLEDVETLVSRIDNKGEYQLIKLDDVFGTTLEDPEIEAMVVSEETRPGAEMVNKKRVELGMTPLPLEVVDLVKDEKGQKISSDRIRQGWIDRDGKYWLSVLESGVVLSGEQKQALKMPMDSLVVDGQIEEYLAKRKITKLAIVGDRSLLRFNQLKLPYDVAVFDGMIERTPEKETEEWAKAERMEVLNQAGEISSQAVGGIEKLVREGGKYLKVVGEEDLLVLPLVLSLPLGSVVVYGQPGEGSVVVEVGEESKRRWYEFLKR